MNSKLIRIIALLWLAAVATSNASEAYVIDLRDLLSSGKVTLTDVKGKGTFGGDSLEAVIRNESPGVLYIATTIAEPIYFTNQTNSKRESLIATHVFIAGHQGYSVESIALPPKSERKVSFAAYFTDFEKDTVRDGDLFAEAETPKDLKCVAKKIATLSSERPDIDPVMASQIALLRAQGRSLEEIRDVISFSDEDLKLAYEILEDVPKEPVTIDFRWEPTFFCGDDCILDELSFSEIYPVPFYQTDAFVYTVIATSVATAATVTFVTAGAGAPAVIPGTSTLIVAAGGGGQGAYMAGLSTIGSLVGSNAVGGAAIINSFGAVVGLGASARGAAFGGVALKNMLGVSAAAYDGILIAENETSGDLVFVAELALPTKLGSDWVRDLAESVYENEKLAAEALGEGNDTGFVRYLGYRNADLLQGVETLKKCWPYTSECLRQSLSRDDLLALSLMAYKAGEFDLFHRVVAYLYKRRNDFEGRTSFLEYVYATSMMMQSNLSEGAEVLKSAIAQEPGIIEPSLLYIAYLGETDFEKSKGTIESLLSKLSKAYDDDDYQTAYSLATAYFRVGHIYAFRGDYQKALVHFRQAKKELNFVQKWPIFSAFMDQNFRQDIELDMAISYFRSGELGKAEELYRKLLEEQDDPLKKQALEVEYLCSTTPEVDVKTCPPDQSRWLTAVSR